MAWERESYRMIIVSQSTCLEQNQGEEDINNIDEENSFQDTTTTTLGDV